MDFDLSKHAILRYIERKGGFQLQSTAEEELKELLSKAVPFDFNGNTQYWRAEDWVLVINTDSSIVVTIFEAGND